MKTSSMTRVALMSAVICILAPISIPVPISTVALTLGTLALYLCAYVLSPGESLIATGLYLLIGAVGIPVFSGYTAGVSRFVSPGGGYLIGYLFLVGISSYVVHQYPNRVGIHAFGMLLGTLVAYSIGTFWMSHVLGTGFLVTLPAGALVFLPLDLVKIAMAISLGRVVQKHLRQALARV